VANIEIFSDKKIFLYKLHQYGLSQKKGGKQKESVHHPVKSLFAFAQLFLAMA